jgi:hypothetical protein
MRAEPSIEQHLRQLEEQLLRPEVRGSTEKVSALLADEFIEFGSSGRVFDRQQIIAALRAESPMRRSLADFSTSVLAPGVVLVTYRAIRDDASGKSPTSSLRSSIWKLIDRRWQMLFHQATLIALGR